jgi:hypothetical protein
MIIIATPIYMVPVVMVAVIPVACKKNQVGGLLNIHTQNAF